MTLQTPGTLDQCVDGSKVAHHIVEVDIERLLYDLRGDYQAATPRFLRAVRAKIP